MNTFFSPVHPNGKHTQDCEHLENIIKNRTLIIASNRGPVVMRKDESGEIQAHRNGGGGLVTALSGLANQVHARWIANAVTDEDKSWRFGSIPFGVDGNKLQIQFISPDDSAYDGFYKVISNPLLWFLQHSMWDIAHSPTIDRTIWQNWENGYVTVNKLFGETIAEQISKSRRPVLVMLQDYHLYLTPTYIRRNVTNGAQYTLMHFIHIPWPGAEDWGMLPPKMRRAILESLCAVDLLGFQTREGWINFIRTVESYLPLAHVDFKRGRIWFNNHLTYVRDFPISIDVNGLKRLAVTEEVQSFIDDLLNRQGNYRIILRIDRIEPSKNIVRGFQAFEEMLELYPEYRNKVKFLALLVPSRLEVDGYRNYLDELMGAAGLVNAKFGSSEWEPIRILVGENYSRAVAALQLYDVLLVNSIADGMNLVAKEGPVINQRDGVLILSERTGARQQLETGALIISPLDIYATAEALHQALSMPAHERRTRAERLCHLVESNDIVEWLCQQLEMVSKLNL